MASWLLALLCVLVIVGVCILGILLHAGLFSDLRIRTTIPASLPRRVAYTVHRGAYSKVGGPLSILSAIASKQKHFCIFYDDPNKVVC